MSGNIYYIGKYAKIVFVHSNIENIGVNYHTSPEIYYTKASYGDDFAPETNIFLNKNMFPGFGRTVRPLFAQKIWFCQGMVPVLRDGSLFPSLFFSADSAQTVVRLIQPTLGVCFSDKWYTYIYTCHIVIFIKVPFIIDSDNLCSFAGRTEHRPWELPVSTGNCVLQP